MAESFAFEVTPEQVKISAGHGETLHLIDVRQPEEHELSRIEGAELIPMDTVPLHLDRLKAIAQSGAIVVFCHHGIRSAHVVDWLRTQGVSNCLNMSGGIERWSRDVDSAVPRY